MISFFTRTEFLYAATNYEISICNFLNSCREIISKKKKLYQKKLFCHEKLLLQTNSTSKMSVIVNNIFFKIKKLAHLKNL